MNYGCTSVLQTAVISIQLTCDAEKNPVRNRPLLLEQPPVHTPLQGTRLHNITNATLHYGITRFADRITDGSLSGFGFTTPGNVLTLHVRSVTVTFWTAKTRECYKLF